MLQKYGQGNVQLTKNNNFQDVGIAGKAIVYYPFLIALEKVMVKLLFL